MKGHTGTVISATFSIDGERVYSESDNNEKIVWDLATRKVISDAPWNPPAVSNQTSPNGRWFVTSELKNVVLVDLEFKNTPNESTYRTAKSEFDPLWHQEQATSATELEDWYAAVFHFAWLLKTNLANPPITMVCDRPSKNSNCSSRKKKSTLGPTSIRWSKNLSNYRAVSNPLSE